MVSIIQYTLHIQGFLSLSLSLLLNPTLSLSPYCYCLTLHYRWCRLHIKVVSLSACVYIPLYLSFYLHIPRYLSHTHTPSLSPYCYCLTLHHDGVGYTQSWVLFLPVSISLYISLSFFLPILLSFSHTHPLSLHIATV